MPFVNPRARAPKFGAWASRQSEKISGPEQLEQWVKDVEHKFADQEVPCPPHWGGWLVRPQLIEFWFGQQGRLHDRYIFQKNGADWVRFMKSP